MCGTEVPWTITMEKAFGNSVAGWLLIFDERTQEYMAQADACPGRKKQELKQRN